MCETSRFNDDSLDAFLLIMGCPEFVNTITSFTFFVLRINSASCVGLGKSSTRHFLLHDLFAVIGRSKLFRWIQLLQTRLVSQNHQRRKSFAFKTLENQILFRHFVSMWLTNCERINRRILFPLRHCVPGIQCILVSWCPPCGLPN